jgi:hypothetical protein
MRIVRRICLGNKDILGISRHLLRNSILAAPYIATRLKASRVAVCLFCILHYGYVRQPCEQCSVPFIEPSSANISSSMRLAAMCSVRLCVRMA